VRWSRVAFSWALIGPCSSIVVAGCRTADQHTGPWHNLGNGNVQTLVRPCSQRQQCSWRCAWWFRRVTARGCYQMSGHAEAASGVTSCKPKPNRNPNFDLYRKQRGCVMPAVRRRPAAAGATRTATSRAHRPTRSHHRRWTGTTSGPALWTTPSKTAACCCGPPRTSARTAACAP